MPTTDPSGDFCGQTQPHAAHDWSEIHRIAPRIRQEITHQCGGHTGEATPGPCHADSGPSPFYGIRYCQLLAGHTGAHHAKDSFGESIWPNRTGDTGDNA